MKTPPALNTQLPHQPSANVNKTAGKRPTASTPDATHISGEEAVAPGETHGRDFASVLRDVTHPIREERDESNTRERDSRDEAKSADRPDRERETQRREDRHQEGGTGGGFDPRGGVREVSLGSEITNARSILHIADLERVVASVRTQIVANGHREVTIELQRSVLEGLRVKLSADSAGRITAEFIASSEQVRAQIDARATELSDLLRSRGIDLAQLRTTVSGDSNQHASGDGRQGETFGLSQRGGREQGAVPAHSPAADRAESDLPESASLYRA